MDDYLNIPRRYIHANDAIWADHGTIDGINMASRFKLRQDLKCKSI